jgi:TonB-linked SusC/RagA family outer membrane protein
LKLNNKPTDKFTLDFSVRFSNTEIRGGGANEVNEVSSADSRLKYAMIYPPFPVSGLTDEGETDDAFNLYHPLTAISDNDRLQKRRTLNMNGSVAWEIIKNLRVKAELGWDDYRNDDTRFYGSTTYFVKNVPKGDDQGKPAIRFVQRGRDTYRSTNTINYDFKKILKDGHNLNVLAGQEYILKKEQHLTSEAFGFPKSFSFDDAYKLSAEGNANTVKNFIERDDILLSWFGRANYDFGGKYLLSAAFRADGSSKFKKGNKWGFFPSAAGAWRISSEPFMEPTKDWLDDLKLRFSYGTAGNNKIPSGLMDQLYVVTGTNWVNGFGSYWAASKTMANPDLVWETTVTRNLGLDITTLNGRLSGSVEVYLNTTKDLLIMYPVSGTGYESQYRNMGDTQNKGIEGTVNWTIISKKNVEFGISANIGFNKNKVISLGLMDRITGDPVTSGWASTEIGQDFITEVGMPVGLMYGYLSDGRYDVNDFDGYDEATDTWILKEGVADASGILGTIRPGTMKLKKTNKLSEDDYLVRIDDRTVIGDTNPLHTGGFTLNGRVYGFDLSASFNWSYGNDVYNANKVEYTSTSKYHSRNMISEMESGKRWTNLREDGTISNDPTELAAMNANTTMWSPYMKAFTFTDWAVEDGSFLRLNTLTLGYSLPKAIIDKVKIQNLRLYVTGYNLFCWTNYSGFDPEVSTRRKTNLTPNVDYSAYPKSRSFVVGLNLSF